MYLKFFSYHYNILEKYDRIFSEQEKAQINQTTSEVKGFFLYIQQMLIIQSVYLLALLGKAKFKGQPWMERLFDIVNSILMISYILMYIGVSQSINRAFKAQYRKRIRTMSKQIMKKGKNNPLSNQ